METYTLESYIGFLRSLNLVKNVFCPREILGRTVSLVSFNSKQVTGGTLFVVKGAHFRPQYLQDAAEAGAFCYISEEKVPGVDLPCVLVTDIRLAAAHLAQKFYNEPWRRLKVTGITGTKGKSTTAYFIKGILDAWEKSHGRPETALISSFMTYNGAERFESVLTTPEPLDLERHFYTAAEHGISYATMEVSSQALKYDRVLGVTFDAAVFLNIGHDHISPIEHPTWEDYFSSKLKIFDQCRLAVVNLDSDHAREIFDRAKEKAGRVVTFSMEDEKADVYGHSLKRDGDRQQFLARINGRDESFEIRMLGKFNVSNALAAIAVCQAYGAPADCMREGLQSTRVAGHMDTYHSADGKITALVDYAHNQLSFQKLFDTVREDFPGMRKVIVFGAPGGKALDRRQGMGETAGKYADFVYITEDDPQEEDPAQINEQIAQAVRAQNCPYEIVPDRREAVRRAVFDCKEPTVILLAGRGEEPSMRRGTKLVPFPTDGELIREVLKEYDRRNSGA